MIFEFWQLGRVKLTIFTPRACARGKVIGLSICRCCSQKTGIFQHLQLQVSREWHMTVKIGEKLT